MILDIIIFILGAILVLATLDAAVRTIVVPRGERSFALTAVFSTLFYIVDFVNSFASSLDRRDTIQARAAPIGLMILPIVWAISVILGFSAMFWALGTESYVDALILSGSSLTTLGFRSAADAPSLGLAIGEGLIGLALVALLVSFLPSIYSVFREREARIVNWANRVGSPPDTERFLILATEIGLLGEMDDEWLKWERWFNEMGESHLSYPALNFFRSPGLHDSWITTAGSVLDTAAFMEAALDTPRSIQAQLCIKSGFVALRQVAEFYNIEYNSDPEQGEQISYQKEEFMALCDRVQVFGVILVPDREQAWVDFSGWRVNYDSVLNDLELKINRYKHQKKKKLQTRRKR